MEGEVIESYLDKNVDASKCFRTLFWAPMVIETAKKIHNELELTISLIADFHAKEDDSYQKLETFSNSKKKRYKILGFADSGSAFTQKSFNAVLKSENTKYILHSVLKRHFLFNQLSNNDLENVIESMQAQYVSKGDVIIQEGDQGDVFYILEDGSCTVSKSKEVIGKLQSPSSFGDLALMYNSPRAATITAFTDCDLWSLDREFFKNAIVKSSTKQIVQLSLFLSKIPLFESLGVLTLNQLARSLTKQSYDDQSYIITQGEMGDKFFVLYKGSVKITAICDNGVETYLMSLSQGAVFGERAIIYKEPRAANVIADGEVECYFLESSHFEEMLGGIVDKMKEMNIFRLFRSKGVFSTFNDNFLKKVISSCDRRVVQEGQRLICGEADIALVTDGKMESPLDGAVYAVGDVVGDEGGGGGYSGSYQQLHMVPTAADSTVIVSIAFESIVYVIDRSVLLTLSQQQASSPVPIQTSISHEEHNSSDIYHDEHMLDAQSLSDQFASRRLRQESRSNRLAHPGLISIDSTQELDITNFLGRGSFGNVYLAKHKIHQVLVVIKCLDKTELVRCECSARVTEKEIIALETFCHPFIVQYHGTLLTPQRVCMFFEFCGGGDLWSLLHQRSKPIDTASGASSYGGLPLPQTQQYVAMVVLALEHIHEREYVYRDLKTENCLLTTTGHIKLVEFYLSKRIPYTKDGTLQYRTYTLCGTPDCLAPEIVLYQGHDRAADLWALGVLLFELLCGRPPFEGESEQAVFQRIVQSRKFLSFPSEMDPHSKSFIRRLLNPKPTLRLGILTNGFADIKQHAFFSSSHNIFDNLLHHRCAPLWVPEAVRMSCFDSTAHETILTDIGQVCEDASDPFWPLTTVEDEEDALVGEPEY